MAGMGLGKTGAANAALLAVQILSLKDKSLLNKLKDYKKRMTSQVEDASRKLKQGL